MSLTAPAKRFENLPNDAEATSSRTDPKHDSARPSGAAQRPAPDARPTLTKEDLIAFRTHLIEIVAHMRRWLDVGRAYAHEDNLAFSIACTGASLSSLKALTNALDVNQVQIETWDTLAHLDSSEKADYVRAVLRAFDGAREPKDPFAQALAAFCAEEDESNVFEAPSTLDQVE